MTAELNQLYFRRQLAQGVLQILGAMQGDINPRTGQVWDEAQRLEALKHYQGQLAEIEKRITEITGTPPPVVVGLKTANLFSKVER